MSSSPSIDRMLARMNAVMATNKHLMPVKDNSQKPRAKKVSSITVKSNSIFSTGSSGKFDLYNDDVKKEDRKFAKLPSRMRTPAIYRARDCQGSKFSKPLCRATVYDDDGTTNLILDEDDLYNEDDAATRRTLDYQDDSFLIGKISGKYSNCSAETFDSLVPPKPTKGKSPIVSDGNNKTQPKKQNVKKPSPSAASKSITFAAETKFSDCDDDSLELENCAIGFIDINARCFTFQTDQTDEFVDDAGKLYHLDDSEKGYFDENKTHFQFDDSKMCKNKRSSEAKKLLEKYLAEDFSAKKCYQAVVHPIKRKLIVYPTDCILDEEDNDSDDDTSLQFDEDMILSEIEEDDFEDDVDLFNLSQQSAKLESSSKKQKLKQPVEVEKAKNEITSVKSKSERFLHSDDVTVKISPEKLTKDESLEITKSVEQNDVAARWTIPAEIPKAKTNEICETITKSEVTQQALPTVKIVSDEKKVEKNVPKVEQNIAKVVDMSAPCENVEIKTNAVKKEELLSEVYVKPEKIAQNECKVENILKENDAAIGDSKTLNNLHRRLAQKMYKLNEDSLMEILFFIDQNGAKDALVRLAKLFDDGKVVFPEKQKVGITSKSSPHPEFASFENFDDETDDDDDLIFPASRI